MKVLHIIAQKPSDTGSGVYISNIVRHIEGWEQEILAGVDVRDSYKLSVPLNTVVFNRGELDFPVVGMSDEMPYESSMYRELRGERLRKWKNEFIGELTRIKKEFQPDIVISHHLYLITAIAREVFPREKVIGVCHATDMRQLRSHDLEKEYILEKIPKLDRIAALHERQKVEISERFSVEGERIEVMGLGYDDTLFNGDDRRETGREIWYVGKVSSAKGVGELLEAFELLNPEAALKIAGGWSGYEGEGLIERARRSGKRIEILGRLSQKELSEGLKGGRVLVLPSYYEGFPMVVIEALASGMDVVVNDLPGLREALGEEIIQSGRVYLVDMPRLRGVDTICLEERRMYIEKLRKTLERALTDTRKKGEIDLERFTWKGLGRRYESLLRGL